jgi:hypothetical protein
MCRAASILNTSSLLTGEEHESEPPLCRALPPMWSDDDFYGEGRASASTVTSKAQVDAKKEATLVKCPSHSEAREAARRAAQQKASQAARNTPHSQKHGARCTPGG